MSEDSKELLTVINFSERVPLEQKLSNGKLWAKKRIEAADIQYPDCDQDYKNRVEDNYRLISGLPMIHYAKDAYWNSQMDMQSLISEGIDMPDTKMEHFDWVSAPLDILWGDRKKQRFRYTITDSSKATQNYIKQYKRDALTTHFETKLIAPIKQFALLQWMAKYGVKDLMALNDEERKQMESDVNASANSLIPKDIAYYIKSNNMGQIEKQLKSIADALVATLDFKYRVDEAYLHAYANDGIILKTDVRNNRPYFGWVDLTGFNTGGGKDIFVNNNPWFKEVEQMHPSKIWDLYSSDFNKEDRRLFDAMVKAAGGGSSVDSSKDEQVAMRIDFQGRELLQSIDMKTKEGQAKNLAFEHVYRSMDAKSFNMIRVADVTWASLAEFSEVTRVNDGILSTHYYTGDYEMDRSRGDLEVEKIWAKQYWGGVKIGQGEGCVYANVGPKPFQYRNIADPRDCRSPYVGGYFNDLSGKGYRRTPLDRAKPLIHAANRQMKTIQEREATDIGKVVLMTVAAKPRGWTWGKLLSVVRATKMLPINTQQSGLTAADVQFFRSVDMTSMYDILPRIEYLRHLGRGIGDILAVNNARSGSQAASTSVGNNASNLDRSFSQTHPRAAWADKISEMTLENLIYLGKMCVKSGNIFLRYALDDLSIANIDIDVDELDEALLGIKVSTDPIDLAQLDIPKNVLVPYIQKNDLGFGLIMETVVATTRGELIEISTKAEIEAAIKQAQAMDFAKMSQQEQAQMALQTEKDLLELKSALKRVEDELNNTAKKEMAAIQSMTIAHGNDIDGNNENDYLQSAEQDRQQKREEVLIKDALERDKLALQDRWNSQELTILAKKVEALGKKPPAKPKKKGK